MKPTPPSASRIKLRLVVVAVLLAGLLVTAGVVQFAKTQVARSIRREFDFASSEIQEKIVERISAHEQGLRSAAAFFAHASDVTRTEWQRFAVNQKIDQHLPGIQGLGFALLIPREKLAQHVQEVRAEGFPDYQVRPAGEREIYSSIIFIEPFTGRNLRAFGYDMLSEAVRRAALERARDQDVAALSGKVQLVQETDQDIQAGTLMFVPVYRHGMPTETVTQRRAAIRGWVYSPYRMPDLLRGILGRADLRDARRIHLKIFDGEQASAAMLLYDSQPDATQPSGGPARLNLQRRVVVAGRLWTLQYATPVDPTAYGVVWLVLLSGTSITLLLAGFVFNLLNTRFKAEQIASQLTQELLVKMAQHWTIIQTAMDGFWVTDLEGRILEVNAAYCRMSGYRTPELLAMRVTDLEVGPAANAMAARIPKIMAQGAGRFESCHRRKDGSVFEVEISVQYQPSTGGRLMAFLRDITQRKQAEAALRVSESQLQAILESSVDGLLVVDNNGKVIKANRHFAELWRIPLSVLEGHNDKALLAFVLEQVADPEAFLKGVQALYESDKSLTDTLAFNDGRVFERYSIALRIDGNVLGRVWSFRDITARKLAAEQLQANNRQLQEALAKLQQPPK